MAAFAGAGSPARGKSDSPRPALVVFHLGIIGYGGIGTVPITSCTLQEVREGFVIRNLGGQAKTNENQIKNMMYRVCRLAGLPERGWHVLRHSFGTHAAIFGVNPWRLMTWMGHKRIDETMRYVHVASAHMRDLPKELLDAASASSEHDPDRRVLIMLGARGSLVRSWQPDGNTGSPFLKVAGT